MPSTIGRRVVVPLTNRSGGSVAAGDVVVIGDGTNDECFTTTTTASFSARNIGIAQETIASLATGRVLVRGYASLVNVNASVTRDHFLFTHTVAKQATGSASRGQGAFGQILKTSATPSALIWGDPDQAIPGIGAWTDYTPTWTASTTNPTLGSTTIVGRYKSIDSKTYIVQISISITTGGAWNPGSGSYIFSLPSGLTTPNTGRFQIGSAHVLDNGTAHFAGICKVAPNATTIGETIIADATGTRHLAATVPVTWATSDQINLSVLIEVA